MNRLAPAMTVLLSVVALTACTNAPVTSETVTRVRVLAIRAEPPSVRAGDTVSLRALVVTPVKNDPDVTITWSLCQFGSLEDCARAGTLNVFATGTAATLTVPTDVAPGDAFVVWLDAKKHGQVERALKSLPVIAATDAPNHNPDIASIGWGDDPTVQVGTVAKNARMNVHLVMQDSPAEFYFDSDENAAEEVRVHTYTSGGFLVDPSGTDASGELYYQGADSAGDYGLWVVVSDGRGGTDWRETWINVPKGDSSS